MRSQQECKECCYLLCNDEHSNQEQGDVYAAHHLGVFHQPYPSQDGFIFSAVKQMTTFGKPF